MKEQLQEDKMPIGVKFLSLKFLGANEAGNLKIFPHARNQRKKKTEYE